MLRGGNRVRSWGIDNKAANLNQAQIMVGKQCRAGVMCFRRRPRASVAAVRSTLSMPTPARPTTRRRPLAASKTARVTWAAGCRKMGRAAR